MPGSVRSAALARPTSSPTTARWVRPTTARATVAIVGLGSVGRWLLDRLARDRDSLASRYGVELDLVAIGSRRRGFAAAPGGLDPAAALAAAEADRPLAELPGVKAWPDAGAGLRDCAIDVLAEVSASPADDAAATAQTMRDALERGVAVATSNKWPVALHGRELAELARDDRVPFRAEATVMSGTPVLGPLTEGMAGATPAALRGVLNATANFILCEVEGGRSYGEALADAQRRGLAERDPSADVDGHDATAKLMILAGLVFGRQLELGDVERAGISGVEGDEVAAARADGFRTREVASLAFDGDAVRARVAPVTLGQDDALAVEGPDNAIACEAEPLGRVVITGPGAGPRLAGQGVLSDLINCARARVARG